MPVKKTQQQFIADVVRKYGEGTFDLSRVVYVNSTTKVQVICRSHGQFEVQPNNFLYGKGCPICSKERMVKKLQTPKDELVKRVQEIHGNSIQLLSGDFKNQHEVVEWSCKKHGVFKASLRNVLSGSGCKFCSRESSARSRSKGANHYIPLLKEIHGDFFDYSKSIFSNSKDKIVVSCPTHGDFTVLVSNHLKGKGCRKCANQRLSETRSMTLEYASNRLKAVYGSDVTFPKILDEFKTRHSHITGICKEHGEFKKTVTSLIYNESGCPKCSSGVDRTKPTYFYINSLGKNYIKVGVTNHLKTRLNSLQLATCLSVENILNVKLESGYLALDLEKLILNSFSFGVLSRDIISQGFTETTDKYNLEPILDIIFDFFTNNTF